jgi:hypothetical protein
MAAKWVDTVILKQVNCVVRSRALEPLLFFAATSRGWEECRSGAAGRVESFPV